VPLSRFRLQCGERFRYEYDFTADWKLDIRLEGVLPFGAGTNFLLPMVRLPSGSMVAMSAGGTSKDISR
jgi:hypothetical protein